MGTQRRSPDEEPDLTGMAWRDAMVERRLRDAASRGEFDDLPLAGKPIPGLGTHHDPDWWIKSFIEREQISGVLPEALQLRTDDAVLDERLDAMSSERQVREHLQEFNERIVAARRQLRGGPPVVTRTREIAAEVARWRARRYGAGQP